MAFTEPELKRLADLVIAGGKSPTSGGEGLMMAAEAIGWIQRELQALATPPAPVPANDKTATAA